MSSSVALPKKLPVMPLPGAVLFPHALLPLYIFEPRYRQMLKHALQHHRMFCVTLIKPSCPEWHAPEDFFHFATAGLIRACVGRGGHVFKNVIVRAIGPSLGGVDALADPLVELHDSDGQLIAMNDNWKESQEAEITATGVPPSDDRESAIVARLVPGNYTGVVRGSGDTTGVGLVEVFNIP